VSCSFLMWPDMQERRRRLGSRGGGGVGEMGWWASAGEQQHTHPKRQATTT
jgi:hypothetical protein